MEARFNNLVENFQKYINQKEQEINEKENKIKELTRRNEETLKEDQYNPLNIDDEERNTAMKIYSEIMEDYSIPQERDEAMLDTVEKYIYDKKQPNIAYLLWEAADFNH